MTLTFFIKFLLISRNIIIKLSQISTYRRVSIVVLNQFLRVSRKFENNRYTPLAQVRILSWDFFPLYFFYSFYQILIRSRDVELHTKFQPHKHFFEGVIQYFRFLKKPFQLRQSFNILNW
jgi:hypothetical protein